MLKSYSELRKLDVTPYCDIRKGKDDNGKEIAISYLNWAKCMDLLHENGAEEVWYTPVANASGSFVSMPRLRKQRSGAGCVLQRMRGIRRTVLRKRRHADLPRMRRRYGKWEHYETQDKNGQKLGCYFVRVRIHIDASEWEMDYPLLNGQLVVRAETINQLRISNAHARAFVKGVAIRTGLGFGLWANDTEGTDDKSDDLSIHSIWAIKERVERRVTSLLSRGMSMDELLRHIGISQKQYESVLKGFSNIHYLEQKLGELR